MEKQRVDLNVFFSSSLASELWLLFLIHYYMLRNLSNDFNINFEETRLIEPNALFYLVTKRSQVLY